MKKYICRLCKSYVGGRNGLKEHLKKEHYRIMKEKGKSRGLKNVSQSWWITEEKSK